MKKVILLLTVAATAGLTACSKCKVCIKESSPEVRLCEKDYNTKTEYGITVDAYELAGFKCKESL